MHCRTCTVAGLLPAFVMATIGTTSSCAVDPVPGIAECAHRRAVLHAAICTAFYTVFCTAVFFSMHCPALLPTPGLSYVPTYGRARRDLRWGMHAWSCLG